MPTLLPASFCGVSIYGPNSTIKTLLSSLSLRIPEEKCLVLYDYYIVQCSSCKTQNIFNNITHTVQVCTGNHTSVQNNRLQV